MAISDSYSFNCLLHKSGKPTRYIAVLSFLDKIGPTHRHEILKNVWRVTNADYHECYREHMSTLFAAMRRSGIVDYDSKTYKWSITNKGRDVLDKAKHEWGKRYAVDYWDRENL